MKTSKNWFKLDNAGKLYPSIASSRVSTLYRVTTVTKENVNPKRLNRALEKTLKEMPFFNVRLKRGFFWYYIEEMDSTPLVEMEKYYPCTAVSYKKTNERLFKVFYYQNRIHIEMSHALCDGAGALHFLNRLLFHYYQRGVHLDTPFSTHDAFSQYFNPLIPSPPKIEKAYHFPFKLVEKGVYHASIGTVSAKAFLNLAKKHNTSVTKLLLCYYFETIQSFMLENKETKKPIVLNMPVNLRGLFPSDTIRNFFVSLTPTIDPRLGDYSREEILKHLDHYFGLFLNPKHLQRYIARNVRNEKFWHVRMIPLFIKDFIMPTLYSYYGESSYTSSISNLGVIHLDVSFKDHVEKIFVLPPPSEGNLLKIVTATCGDAMTIAIGSLSDDKTIERDFFRKLRQEGLRVDLETNY